MQTKHSHAKLISGVDDLSLDKRDFDPPRKDIENICRFFSIGKLRHFKKEKGISVSHANFFVFAATTKGNYALKFYPTTAAQSIATEYAINRILAHYQFPSPLMYAGQDDQPFYASNDLLTTCYSYINGLPAWKSIRQQDTIHKINATTLSLKNTLTLVKERIPLQKQERLEATIKSLAQSSCSLAPYDQKELIDATLLQIYRSYQLYKPLFIRQKQHNNTNLTNFLIYKKTVYTLDLSHIREDYVLSDLACLVISCLFFNTPQSTIKIIVKDYFTQHKLEPQYHSVLNALVKVRLIREYLKNVQRQRSIEPSVFTQDLVLTYNAQLSKRKKTITTLLKRMDKISDIFA